MGNSLFFHAEVKQGVAPRGFSHHQLVCIRVKPLLDFTRLGALHDVFGLTPVSCLSLIGAGQGDRAVAYLGGLPWMAA